MDRSKYISAGEINEFVYCKRGWWLSLHKMRPVTSEMQLGAKIHESLPQKTATIKSVQKTLLVLTGISLIALLFLLIIFAISNL